MLSIYYIYKLVAIVCPFDPGIILTGGGAKQWKTLYQSAVVKCLLRCIAPFNVYNYKVPVVPQQIGREFVDIIAACIMIIFISPIMVVLILYK